MSCIEKIEEAIQNLEAVKAEIDWYLPMSYEKSFDLAIEALKKQTPMKMSHEYVFYNKVYNCPACGNQIEPAEYCSKCGQKLEVDYGV